LALVEKRRKVCLIGRPFFVRKKWNWFDSNNIYHEREALANALVWTFKSSLTSRIRRK